MKNKKIKHKTAVFGANAKNETTLDRTLRTSFWGLLITIALSFALLLAGTAVAFLTDDPTAFVDPVGYVALFMSAFFGGFASAKLNKRAPYLTSALAGAGFVILSMLVSFTLPHSLASGSSIWLRLALHALSLLTFFIGAFASKKASAPQRKPKRKKRR